jgi:hypothetical protein
MDQEKQKIYLLITIIVLLFLQILLQSGLIVIESMTPWDTGSARFQQEGDSYLMSNSLRMNQHLANTKENLTGGYEPPIYESGIPSEQKQSGPLYERSEDTLENSLHGF